MTKTHSNEARRRPAALDEAAPASDAVAIHALVFEAADGTKLAGSLFEPRGPARAQLILHGATAVPHRYYRRFATFLAERGLRVLAYDYRGVGASRAGDLRRSKATMTDWAALDAPAAVRALVAGRPDLPLVALGHSFGGQVAALLEGVPAPVAVVHVGAQLGSTHLHPMVSRIRFAALLRYFVPAITAAAGYLPASAGLGEALPSGVVREWASWCLAPDYFLGAHPEYGPRLARYGGPIYSVGFTDDVFAPPRAVRGLLRLHRSARVIQQLFAPRDLDTEAIGHFAAFRDTYRDTLWSAIARFVDAALEGDHALDAFEGVPGVPVGPLGRRFSEVDVTADLTYGRD